jgi:hypothetical protein
MVVQEKYLREVTDLISSSTFFSPFPPLIVGQTRISTFLSLSLFASKEKWIKSFAFPLPPYLAVDFLDEIICMINLEVPFLGNLEQQGVIHNAVALH